MTYYYAVNGQQTGPVSEEELRRMVASGSIPAETPIWREGMADWQPFSVALGGGVAAAPGGEAIVKCVVCHQTFPADQTIRYGSVNVCAGCKPRFVQGLREGASTGAMEWAGIGARFAAKFLDNIILWIIQTAVNFAIVGTVTGPNAASGAASALAGGMFVLNLTIGIIYQAVFLHWRGQTPGKMALKIKVVTPEGGSLSWGKSIARPLAEILSGCILAIGYLIAIWDPEKRALHDRLVGTRVIKADK
jgi:uncharacterized RDD family membrane protein YckC